MTSSSNHGEPSHRFASDRPLNNSSNDLLNRRHFAERLASDILHWHGRDSLVISINGDWGSGKTTLKNFVTESLKANGDPIIVEFNPWMWSGQDKLLEGFFGELKTAFRLTDKAGQTEKLVARWESLEAITKLGAEVSDQISKVLTALYGSSVTVALISNNIQDAWTRKALMMVGVLGLAASIFFTVAPAILGKFVEFLKVRFGHASRSLELARADVAKQLDRLREAKRPVIVIMDDIDRLKVTEICLLFQLVKANADFPNLTYLLLFQKDIVETALDQEFGRGREYLRKVIQIDFDLPHAPRDRMQRILREGIEKILNRDDPKLHWENDRFVQLFEDNLWPYFRTMRDIKRFLAVFDFHFSGQVNRRVLELNPVDLIAIEVLRIFDHTAYSEIRDSFGYGDNAQLMLVLLKKEERRKTIKVKVDAIANRPTLSTSEKSRLRAILTLLFDEDGDSLEAERTLRICHHTHFPKYFQNALYEDRTSASAIQSIVDQSNDRTELARQLQEISKEKSIYEVLRKLFLYRENIPIQNYENLITALFDAGDEFPKPEVDWISREPTTEAARVIYFTLKLVSDQTQRGVLIRRALSASKGIIVPTILASLLNVKKADESGESPPWSTISFARRSFPKSFRGYARKHSPVG